MKNQVDTGAPVRRSLRPRRHCAPSNRGDALLNLNEDHEIFIVFSAVFAGPGLYLLLAGAVAEKITLARG